MYDLLTLRRPQASVFVCVRGRSGLQENESQVENRYHHLSAGQPMPGVPCPICGVVLAH
jgi:hypothetical protein